MNQDLPACPECSSDDTYELGPLLVCPHCGHEWAPGDLGTDLDGGERVIRDAVGNVLADGDTVAVVKDLRLKGGSGVIKVGTKVRNIRLVDGVGDHDIECRVDGVGPLQLRSGVVRKV